MSFSWFDNQAFSGASAHRRLRAVYVGALVLIGALVLAAGAVTAAGIARSEPLSAAVHLAGRQRVHSQLLTKAALQLAVGVGEPEVLRGQMGESIKRLRSVHAALRNGDAALGVPADLPASVHARLDQLRPTMEKLLATAEVLAMMDPPEPATGPVLQRLLTVERAVVPQFEAAVVELSEYAQSVSTGMHARVQWLGLACLVLLAAVGLLVFEPATRVIGRQVGEIDRQRRLAEQLARDAQAADRAKTAFLANMSHEIRTPLAAMLGYADLLREDGDLALAPLSRLQHLERLSAAGRQLLTLMDGILDMSRLQAEAMSIREGPLDVAGVVREVERATAPTLAGRPVELSCTAEGGATPGLVGDADRVRQILLTLMSNACKFTLKGRVSLRVRLEAAGDAATLVAEVEDTGVGMSPDQAGIIFQPFSQGDDSLTRRFGGVGMGLSVARRLAQLMGGDIALARTVPGEGSVFVARIPLRRAGGSSGDTSRAPGEVASASASAEVMAVADAPLAGRVLLVEDGPDNQRIIAFHLRRAGLEVTIAENGRAALRVLAGQSFDLIVSDMQMPEMDGYSLANHLRVSGSRTPIIALTAHAMVGDRERCLAAGCSDYLAKPVSRQALVAACRTWLAARAGAGSGAGAGAPARAAA